MIPKTGNVSLKQALADCDIKPGDSEYSLNNRIFRDRRGASGDVNLNSLRGTVTSMHSSIYSAWGYSESDRMRWQGYKKRYGNPSHYTCDVQGNFTTNMTCNFNSAGDSGTELLHHGYCDAGSYNLSGTMMAGTRYIYAPANWSIYVASNGYLNGDVEVLLNVEDGSSSQWEATHDFTVPAGKPYLTLVLRQLAKKRNSQQVVNTPFKNWRVTKK